VTVVTSGCERKHGPTSGYGTYWNGEVYWIGGPLAGVIGNVKAAPSARTEQVIYWHRELPPLEAEAMGEHTVEASSRRVPGMLAHRDELWNNCYEDLMQRLRIRLVQEVTRLGGDYAHVRKESVDSKHSERPRENWLHGRLTYMLYRQPVRR